MTTVTVLGLGRMGTALAARLAGGQHVRTWTRSGGGDPVEVVRGANLVFLCLYDGAACRDVLDACAASLSPGMTILNTTTVGSDEAAALEHQVLATGAAYLHAPVLGSTDAVAAGRLTIIVGGEPDEEVAAVLALLGETVEMESAPAAAALKLVANGVLGDAVSAVRRSLTRGDAVGLPRDAVVDVVARGVLGRLVAGRRDILVDGAHPPATFTAGALGKDLALLSSATGTLSETTAAVETLMASRAVEADDDIGVLCTATPDLAWLADARLDVSPEVVADPAVLEPLHAYALTHATGDPSHVPDAFLPTAHIEGYRDGELSSWDVATYARLFDGPARDEATRSRRIERLDVRGSVATAIMTLHHGEVTFTDVFVLVRHEATGQWRIANKAYEKVTADRVR